MLRDPRAHARQNADRFAELLEELRAQDRDVEALFEEAGLEADDVADVEVPARVAEVFEQVSGPPDPMPEPRTEPAPLRGFVLRV